MAKSKKTGQFKSRPGKTPTKIISAVTRPSPIDLWLEYLFYAIAVLLPLQFSRITFDQFDIIKLSVFRLLTLAVLILWLVKIFTAKKTVINWTNLDFLLVAFLVLVLISSFTSIHVFTSFQGKYKRYEGFYTLFNYGVLYFLGIQIFSDRRRIARLTRIITATATVVAAYGLIQYFGLDPINWGQTPFEARSSFSSFGNPDLLAGYLALALPIALGCYLSARNYFESALFGLGFFLISGSLLTTYTRGAWLGALVGGVTYLLLNAGRIREQLDRVVIIALIFFIFFTVVWIYSASAGKDVLDLSSRIKSAVNFSSGTVATRLEIWKSGLAMVKDRPLFGQGPDTFRLASEKYETLNYVKLVRGGTVADNAHNYTVQLLAGTGIPATLLFLIFIFGIFYFSVRNAWAQPAAQLGPQLMTSLLGFGLTIGGIGFVSYLIFVSDILKINSLNPDTWKIALLSLGIWAAFSEFLIFQKASETSRPTSSYDYSYSGMVAGAVGYFVYLSTGISVVGSSTTFWIILAAMAAVSGIKKTWVVDRQNALVLNGGLALLLLIPMLLGTITGLSMLRADFNFARAYFLTNTGYGEAFTAYERAFSYYPNGRYISDLGRLYLQLGQSEENIDKAMAAFEKARDTEPLEADYRVFLANAYAMKYSRSGEQRYLDMALDELERVVSRRPYSVPGRYLLGNFYLKTKRYKQAIEQLRVVEMINPGYPDLFTLLSQAYESTGDVKQASYYEQKAAAK